jgi:hypothetical protein
MKKTALAVFHCLPVLINNRNRKKVFLLFCRNRNQHCLHVPTLNEQRSFLRIVRNLRVPRGESNHFVFRNHGYIRNYIHIQITFLLLLCFGFDP